MTLETPTTHIPPADGNVFIDLGFEQPNSQLSRSRNYGHTHQSVSAGGCAERMHQGKAPASV